MPVHKGRHVARMDGDFVVFLIGMRVNEPWKVRDWMWVFRAMPRMIKELEADPGSGFLGATQGLWSTGPTIVQYWRSFDHLEAFAKDADDPHLDVWRSYWRRVGKSTRTGIWHETFLVRAGEYEAVYGNMPTYGLAKASRAIPVAEAVGARGRLKVSAG